MISSTPLLGLRNAAFLRFVSWLPNARARSRAGYSPTKNPERRAGHFSLATTLKDSHLVRQDLESMVEESEKEALAEMKACP